MKLQDYVWRDEKKRIEHGIFQENIGHFATDNE
jgi:hypothetical protein